ncbi:hypothetical protein BDZ45DRAFT_731344 [Acephala macrosclerotiorum]|nr:hypothetical protein BDZ45DRAFT_731344 [Acephala macrosclerotiorum]
MVHVNFSRYILVLTLLVAIAVAANAQHSTSASLPLSNKVEWEPGPTQRGTLTLTWSCVATIITCTWSTLHLNVPARQDDPWRKRFRKVKWMWITILFPKFIFSKAICEFKDAVDDTYEIKRRMQMQPYDPIWSLAMAVVDWTLTHSYLANMGGLIDTYGQSILTSDLIDRCLGLKLDLYFLPSEEGIADKSKADLLVKLLAVSQILWLVFSVAVVV